MISFLHRTIFVHVPKCAGQTIELAFLRDIAPEAQFQRHKHLLGCFPRPQQWDDAFPERLAHLTAQQYVDLDFVPSSIWESYYKFAIVRDPVERCVSMWRYREAYTGDFESFVATFLPRRLKNGHYWFASQYAYTHSAKTGACLVDDIIPLHQLNDRWDALRERTGLKIAELPTRNQSAKPPPSRISDRAIESIRRLYADDYAHMGQYFTR